MTLRIGEDGLVELIGDCPSGDAETLLQHLSAHPEAKVDWRACSAAHTAVVQVLIAAGVAPQGPAGSRFLGEMVEPLLEPR